MYIEKDHIRLLDLKEIDESFYQFRYVDAIALTKDNKIILQKRGDDQGSFPSYLSSFGGQIESGEKPIEALVRELHEELGAKVKESAVVSLGAVTEAVTDHSELVYVYFWHDKEGTITGCYEGEVRSFDNIKEILSEPKLMDNTRWVLGECVAKGLL